MPSAAEPPDREAASGPAAAPPPRAIFWQYQGDGGKKRTLDEARSRYLAARSGQAGARPRPPAVRRPERLAARR